MLLSKLRGVLAVGIGQVVEDANLTGPILAGKLQAGALDKVKHDTVGELLDLDVWAIRRAKLA